MKRRLVEIHDEGGDVMAGAAILHIKPGTARSIIKKHLDGEPLDDARGGRRETTVKVSEDVINRMVAILEQQADVTLTEIASMLRGELQLQLSLATIARYLDGKIFTTKKLEDCPAERNSLRTKNLRRAYADWYLQEGLTQTLVYVDETCFNIFTRRTRGRAPRGQAAVRHIHGNRGPNLNLVAAVASGIGVVYFELQRGTMTGKVFSGTTCTLFYVHYR